MKILILCTGNSCRSQMAEGFLRALDNTSEIFSAGTNPEKQVSPYAILVMREAGIDISANKPKSKDQFLDDEFDYVITVCDDAKEKCPYFTGKVRNRLHQGFEDPAGATGSREEILQMYRKVRDQISEYIKQFYNSHT